MNGELISALLPNVEAPAQQASAFGVVWRAAIAASVADPSRDPVRAIEVDARATGVAHLLEHVSGKGPPIGGPESVKTFICFSF